MASNLQPWTVDLFLNQALSSGTLGPSFGPCPELSDLEGVLASLQPQREGVASFSVCGKCWQIRSEQGPSRTLLYTVGSGAGGGGALGKGLSTQSAIWA